jgi:hypothetical protein
VSVNRASAQAGGETHEVSSKDNLRREIRRRNHRRERGASAAQHASERCRVLRPAEIDKGDFASGSSSRSSRLLHCGLRYLAPGASMWDFARHPGMLATALKMAKQAKESRADW